MNKSLATFMVMASTVIIMITLILGIAFSALVEKNKLHEKMMQTEHQVKFK